MGAVVENTTAQWGAIGLMLLSGGWLVHYLVQRLAAAEQRREKREDELLIAYRESTAAHSTAAARMAQVLEAIKELRQ